VTWREGWVVEGEAARREKTTPGTVDAEQLRELLDQMERANLEIEKLVNRTNTLVHLLDILNKRVDRLESQR